MSELPVRIVHVTPQLSLGGAGRALIGFAKYSSRSGNYSHAVISLQQPDQRAVELAKSAGVQTMMPCKGDMLKALKEADIVQLHFWNTPQLYVLMNSDLPAMRSVIWLHVNGTSPPHTITRNICDIGDIVVASDAETLRVPELADIGDKLEVILSGMDPERLKHYSPINHSTFNIGYIGTLSSSKMHRDFVAMHAEIGIPSVRIIVYGEGPDAEMLKRQARNLGAYDRFEFRGYADNIGEALSTFDVFGYPLCEDNYSTAELVLQESMYAGIPPVVLPFGGAANRVAHQETGLVAQDRSGYVKAIEFLYQNPIQRARLGANARDHACREFSAEITALKFNDIYDRLMKRPKRYRLSEKSVPEQTNGASLFLSSLGEIHIDFQASLRRDGGPIAVAAEERISGAAARLFETIMQYRNSFPDDPSLRFWSGLILQALGRPALAASEFSRCIKLGSNHWRLYWHLAKAAGKAGSASLAATAFAQAKVSAKNEGIILE